MSRSIVSTTAPSLNRVPRLEPPPDAHSFAARLTDDLFLGAYLVAEGARLVDTQCDGGLVAFVIEGDRDELTSLEAAYRSGEARANVLRLKSALTHLKDVMFARLRSEQRGTRRDERSDRCPSPRPRSNG